jgi:hypothetical protein
MSVLTGKSRDLGRCATGSLRVIMGTRPGHEGSVMSESTWFIDPEAGAVSAEDDDNYDEAYGPGDPHPTEGRLVEDDEGVRSDTTKEAVAHVAEGDTAWKSAEESAVHVIDENAMADSDLVDMDELPENPDER